MQRDGSTLIVNFLIFILIHETCVWGYLQMGLIHLVIWVPHTLCDLLYYFFTICYHKNAWKRHIPSCHCSYPVLDLLAEKLMCISNHWLRNWKSYGISGCVRMISLSISSFSYMQPCCGWLMTSWRMMTYQGGVQRGIRHVPYTWVIDHRSGYKVEYPSKDINTIF